MQHSIVDGIDVYQFETLPGDRVQAAVFGRNGGASIAPFASLNMSTAVGDDPDVVKENWRRAYGVFGRTVNTLTHAHLKHDNNVVRVTKADHGSIMPSCDGLITNDPGTGLAMNFADCGSVFLYDPVQHAIGLGHAGWRGTIANLAGNMVRRMSEEFGSKPSDLIATLGPCISVDNYEVDEPVISEVQRAFPKWVDRLLSYRADIKGNRFGRPHYNLALANHINLYEADVKTVELPTFCTAAATDRFFSHRAEKGKTGRFGTVFILR